MTDEEKALKRENLQLRMQLAVLQSQVLQFEHDRCAAELKALEEKPE